MALDLTRGIGGSKQLVKTSTGQTAWTTYPTSTTTKTTTNPGGAGNTGGGAGSNGTGGLLVLYVTGILTFGGSGKLTSVGASGGSGAYYAISTGGGGSGGGHIDIFYKTLSGTPTYTLTGGAAGSYSASEDGAKGGAGGAGSSRATQVALPNLFPSGGAFLLNMV